MADIDRQVESLKARISSAQRAQAVAQHKRDEAAETLKTAINTLTQDFKVNSVDEAIELLGQMESKIQESVQLLSEKLDAAGA